MSTDIWKSIKGKLSPLNCPIIEHIIIMKKVSLKFIVDQLGELGWDYSCGRMSRSGMEIYDGIMRHVGVIKPYEHWNEDCYKDANGDW